MKSPRSPRVAGNKVPPIEDKESDEGTRVVFTFDARSLQVLREMTRDSGFASMGEAVRESLRVVRGLQQQAKKGYSEVIVRNPATGGRKSLDLDFLAPLPPVENPRPKRDAPSGAR